MSGRSNIARTPPAAEVLSAKINRGKALTLIESGIMQPAGLEAVQRAKKDGVLAKRL